MRLNLFKLKHFVATAFALVAFHAGAMPMTWDLASDYVGLINPNGAWQYGTPNGGTFSPLVWNAGTNSYGVAAVGNVFIYQNALASPNFGIDPGKIALEADWGTPDVRWTAPSAGTYLIHVRVGGDTGLSGGGFGNAFANLAGLELNGTAQAWDSFINNVAAWDFTAVLAAGEILDVFVANPGPPGGGNTQTDITITAVIPEPDSLALSLLSLAALAMIRRRRGAAGG